ncbi:hypothetical protein P8452_65672 [Trifolium repens]|nr:hypothetical protein P8452_65672 [Trifolium repens]
MDSSTGSLSLKRDGVTLHSLQDRSPAAKDIFRPFLHLRDSFLFLERLRHCRQSRSIATDATQSLQFLMLLLLLPCIN